MSATATAPARERPADNVAHPPLRAADAPVEPMGLWRKIQFVQTHAGHVEKTGEVKFGSTRFRHMQEHGLLKVLKPLLEEVGLAVTSNVSGWHHDGNTYIIDFQLIVTDVDTGEQTIANYPNVGVDNADKGINKAMTGAMKYALQKFFLIPTEDIDDNETVDQESRRSQGRASRRSAPAGQPTIEGTELATLRESAMEAVQAGYLTNSDVTSHLGTAFHVSRLDQLTKEQANRFAEWLVERAKAAT